MPAQIDQDAIALLQTLGAEPRDSYIGGDHLAKGTGLSPELKKNIEATFEAALAEYHQRQMGPEVSLKVKVLGAGYGEHLFNEIARDIISADIAVFDASELNPNVMLEMGVALTWDVRVLPIKAAGRPSPPSDISGQAWAKFEASGAKFLKSDHQSKLARMVQRAVRKKGKGTA